MENETIPVKEQMVVVRQWECKDCVTSYTAEVEYLASSTNISGEMSQQCPFCDSRDVWSRPIEWQFVTVERRQEIEKNGIRYRMKGSE